MISFIEIALKKARKLEDYQCEPHIQALAVIEAAERLRTFLDTELGIDKTELTHVRWTLAAWAVAIIGNKS